jgi:lipid-A-disaccharide synthase
MLFHFEEAMLSREGARARWVGHPAGALAPDPALREEARRALGIASSETLIAILPGSRRGEVRRHLAPMLDAASRLVNNGPRGIRVAVSDAGPVSDLASRGKAGDFWRLLHPIHHRGDSQVLLRAADLALVASGTATLETAALGVPMVIVYKTGALNYAIARRMVRLPRIGLANIVADTDAAPERIQKNATGPQIASAAARLLDVQGERERQRAAFASLPERLGGSGSAERAADALMEFISARRPVASAASSG